LLIIILLILWIIFFGGLGTLGSIFGGVFQEKGQEEYEEPPVTTIDCTDFNIGLEYKKEFGYDTIAAAKTVCESHAGYWTDARDEISCLWPPPTEPFDCRDYDWIEGSKDFCVNELVSFFYCSPNVAYIGCYCDKDKPEDCQDLCESYGHDAGEFIPSDQNCWEGSVHKDHCCCWDEEWDGQENGDWPPNGNGWDDWTTCDDKCIGEGYDMGYYIDAGEDCWEYGTQLGDCCCYYFTETGQFVTRPDRPGEWCFDSDGGYYRGTAGFCQDSGHEGDETWDECGEFIEGDQSEAYCVNEPWAVWCSHGAGYCADWAEGPSYCTDGRCI
jgi:hypothetical protein